jgi:hypothetical protein
VRHSALNVVRPVIFHKRPDALSAKPSRDEAFLIGLGFETMEFSGAILSCLPFPLSYPFNRP